MKKRVKSNRLGREGVCFVSRAEMVNKNLCSVGGMQVKRVCRKKGRRGYYEYPYCLTDMGSHGRYVSRRGASSASRPVLSLSQPCP